MNKYLLSYFILFILVMRNISSERNWVCVRVSGEKQTRMTSQVYNQEVEIIDLEQLESSLSSDLLYMYYCGASCCQRTTSLCSKVDLYWMSVCTQDYSLKTLI